MVQYLARRIVLGIFTIWVISVLSFAILQLPENQVIEKYIELARGGELDMHLSAFIILMYGTLTIIGTLLSDIALGIAYPRIKLTST